MEEKDFSMSTVDDANFQIKTISSLLSKKKRYCSDILKEAEDEVAKAKSTIHLLKKIIKDYEDEAMKYLEFSPTQKTAIDSITEQIKSIALNADGIGSKVTEIDENIRTIENSNLDNSDKLSLRESKVEENQQNFKQHIKLFEEYLGLRADRFESHLRFTFTCVDDSDAECFFSLKVDENDMYEVFDVIPAVENLDLMIKELNTEKENSPKALKVFFCKIRKSFKKSLLKVNATAAEET